MSIALPKLNGTHRSERTRVVAYFDGLRRDKDAAAAADEVASA